MHLPSHVNLPTLPTHPTQWNILCEMMTMTILCYSLLYVYTYPKVDRELSIIMLIRCSHTVWRYINCTCSLSLGSCITTGIWSPVASGSIDTELAAYLDREVNGEPADHTIRVCLGYNACKIQVMKVTV